MASTDVAVPSLGDRGEEIYECKLRSILEPEHIGKLIVIEVDSGDWEFEGDDHWTGIEKLQKKHPNKVFYEKRVGHPYVTRIR